MGAEMRQEAFACTADPFPELAAATAKDAAFALQTLVTYNYGCEQCILWLIYLLEQCVFHLF